MKDFDFDELDKAVSSVLKQQPGSTDNNPGEVAPADTPSDTSMPQADSAQSEPIDVGMQVNQPKVNPEAPLSSEPVNSEINAEPTSVAPDESLAPAHPSAPQPHPESPANTEEADSGTPSDVESPDKQRVARPIMPQRRGRFMDMVHPSADMQSTQPQTIPKPSRHSGVVISPTAPVAPAKEPSMHQPEESNSEADVADTTSDSNLTDTTSRQAKPGLDDLDTTHDMSNEEPDTNDTFGADETTSETTEMPEEQQREPFIEGAAQSVEKRPLGGYVQPETHEAVETDTAPLDTDHQLNTEPDTGSAQSEQESTPEKHIESDTETVPLRPDHQIPDHTDSPGPSPFITPQYKTQEEAVDGEEHAVFDTSNYHQPLHEQSPASKKHAVFWALLIIALFVGGAAIGALFFLSMN